MIEMGCTIFFTIEYVLRLLTASSANYLYIITGVWRMKKIVGPIDYSEYGPPEEREEEKELYVLNGCLSSCISPKLQVHLDKTAVFILRPMNIIDLIAILPFYLENATGESINLTSLRIGRLIRLVKLFRENRMIPLLANVMYLAADMLSQVFMLLLVFVLIAACFIYVCEEGVYDSDREKFLRENVFGEKEPTPFTSVYISMWWVIQTFTTVGYGDMAPSTPQGRATGCIIMICSLVLFAIPITVVTNVFLREYERDEERRKMEESPESYHDSSDASSSVNNDNSNKTSVTHKIDPWENRRVESKAKAQSILYHAMLRRKQSMRIWGTREPPSQPILWLPKEGNFMEKTFQIWEDEYPGLIGKILQWLVRVAVVTSVMSVLTESLPEYRYPNYGSKDGDTAPVFSIIDTVVVAIFTVELSCRSLSVPFTRSAFLRRCYYDVAEDENGREPSACYKMYIWMLNPMTIIDFFTTIPFYIQRFTTIPDISFLRVVRLLRLLRLIRLFKRLKNLEILTKALHASLVPLVSFGVVLVGWTIFCSSIIFYCEQGTWSEEMNMYERETFYGMKERSPFRSIPDTFYWMVVTITTVGFGDLYPTSLPGRILSSYILFISIVCLAIPITIVAVNISRKNSEYQETLHRPNGPEEFSEDSARLRHCGPEVATDFVETLHWFVTDAYRSFEQIERCVDSLSIKKEKEDEEEEEGSKGQQRHEEKKCFVDSAKTDTHHVPFLPPECCKLMARLISVVRKKSRHTEELMNSFLNKELQLMAGLPCKAIFRREVQSSQGLQMRLVFLCWKRFAKSSKNARRPSVVNHGDSKLGRSDHLTPDINVTSAFGNFVNESRPSFVRGSF
mmetsp:Transcript_29080/g.49299  ORF Transcript_29080/g.49299 Transcript_29080/m.49299 type:complete len:851 (+) Transcript_29080:107-2659(+)